LTTKSWTFIKRPLHSQHGCSKITEKLSGPHRFARDQILRSSQSISQNIAEGNAKRTKGDRKRFFDIARGSAMESASTLDILFVGEAMSESEVEAGKDYLRRIVSMLTKMS
jgi:four helix bundle protein